MPSVRRSVCALPVSSVDAWSRARVSISRKRSFVRSTKRPTRDCLAIFIGRGGRWVNGFGGRRSLIDPIDSARSAFITTPRFVYVGLFWGDTIRVSVWYILNTHDGGGGSKIK